MYLVDTNGLSAGAPGRREQQAALVEWMDARSHDLFLSAITVAEIRDSKSGSSSARSGAILLSSVFPAAGQPCRHRIGFPPDTGFRLPCSL